MLLRYRSLVPLMWVAQIVEILLSMLVGGVKLVTFAHIPAGQMRYQVILTLAVVMLALTLCSGSRAKE